MGKPNQKSTRKRTVPSPGAYGRSVEVWTSSHPLDVPGTRVREVSGMMQAAAFAGKQVTVSENHPLWDRARNRARKTGYWNKAIPKDVGGEFITEKWTVSAPSGRQSITRDRWIDQWRRLITAYTGPVWAVDSNNLSSFTNPVFGFSSASLTPESVLKALGSEAVANTKPTNSVADLSVFLGELLREGLPSLAGSTLFKPDELLNPHTFNKKTPRGLPKKGGGEYLNVEFGWKPIISDMRKFAQAIAHARRVYEQFVRDSGRVVRRRYSFPPVESTSVTTLSNSWTAKVAAIHSDLVSPGPPTGKLVRIDETSIRRWFSGAFTYYVPPLDNKGGIAHYGAIADKLLGSDIDPETIWNLAPWSWAVDWFTNIGDVFANISDMASDGLLLRWGYMMETHSVKRTFILSGPTGYVGNPPASPVVLTYTAKRRVKANPYGFGITWSALSARQKAILVALGLSRK